MTGNESQDQHQGFSSSLSWSLNEQNIFLDTLVEEFINKQPEAMNALVALVLSKVSKISDEGWKRVETKFTEVTGKNCTMMELKEQLKRFTHRHQSTFEHENDTTVRRSPNEIVSTPEKGATSCDGCNANASPEVCVRNLNGSSASKQSLEPENDSPISPSDGENISILGNEGINSSESDFNTPCPEENVMNSNRSCDNLSYQESGPDLDFSYTTPDPYFDFYVDAGTYQSRDVSREDSSPGFRWSPIPIAQFETPENQGSDSYGWKWNRSVTYPHGSVGNSSRSSRKVFHQEGGPDMPVRSLNFEPSDEHQNDALSDSNSDGCNLEESVRNSDRSHAPVLDQQGGVVDSGVNPNVPCATECENEADNVEDFSDGSSSDAEMNSESSRECENVSSPAHNVESSSQRSDSASVQEENATISTPQYEDRRNKRPASDSFDSDDYQRNKWSSYSQPERACGVDQNPDDGDSFSVARCRNILHGMRRIDDQFRDAALEFLESSYYRKFFMQMKHDKRLDWLNSMLGMKH